MFKQEKGKTEKIGFGGSKFLLPITACLTTTCLITNCFAPPSALSAPPQKWQFDPAKNQLEVTVKNGVKPRYSFLAFPARIVLDLPNTEMGTVQPQTFRGAVRQVSVSQSKPGTSRIILELSPNAVLAREQVQLKQVRGSERGTDRWVLRPLFASTGHSTTASKPSAPPSTPKVPASTPKASPSNPSGIAYPPGMGPGEELPDVSANPASARPSSSIPIPVPKPSNSESPNPPSKPSSGSTTAQPQSSSPKPGSSLSRSAPTGGSRSNNLQLSEVNPSLDIPDSLPPGTAQSPAGPPTVSVPPIGASESSQNDSSGSSRSERENPPEPPSDEPPPEAVPPASANSGANSGETVTVPPIASNSDSNSEDVIVPQSSPPERPSEIASNGSKTIEFGQPLPTLSPVEKSAQAAPGVVSLENFKPGVILPSGTVLSLRYPGQKPLKLQARKPRQEILVVQNEIRDPSGKVLIPQGSEVLGRFETNGSGSRFVTQAITLQGQYLAITGKSETISGARQVSADNRLLKNSGIGALAGALLGGLSGGTVIGGAAVGAGVTYATAPKPATIQPGQVIQVRLTEDFK